MDKAKLQARSGLTLSANGSNDEAALEAVQLADIKILMQ